MLLASFGLRHREGLFLFPSLPRPGPPSFPRLIRKQRAPPRSGFRLAGDPPACLLRFYSVLNSQTQVVG